MRALVTGGGGFLGSHIVDRLRCRGHEVTVLCRGSYPWLVQKGAFVVRGDLQDRAAVAAACGGAEVVFHVAARAGIGGGREYHETNVIGTRNIVDACLALGVRRLVYTSSPSVVLTRADVLAADESTPYPRSYLSEYQRTKAEAERGVLAANGTGGLTTTVLRPHAIWGPRDNHLLPRLLVRARRGRLRIVGDGKNRVSLAYVENVAQAHLLAATSERAAGQAYFICDDEPVVLWDWINQILGRLGLPQVTRCISYGAAHAIGLALELVYRVLGLRGEPPMTRYLAAQLAKDHTFDTRRAREELGFVPEVSRAVGMEKMLAEVPHA